MPREPVPRVFAVRLVTIRNENCFRGAAVALRGSMQCQSVLYRSRTLSEWCKRWSLAKTNALFRATHGRWRRGPLATEASASPRAPGRCGCDMRRASDPGRSTVDEPDRTAHGCRGGDGLCGARAEADLVPGSGQVRLGWWIESVARRAASADIARIHVRKCDTPVIQR